MIDGLRTERNRMSSALPDTMDLDDFLQSVENAALAAGIKLVEFVPQPQESTDLYLRIPIKLRLIGTYGEVVSFFDALRALERIVNVENVDLKAKRESETRQLVEATCLATTFHVQRAVKCRSGGHQAMNKQLCRLCLTGIVFVLVVVMTTCRPVVALAIKRGERLKVKTFQTAKEEPTCRKRPP